MKSTILTQFSEKEKKILKGEEKEGNKFLLLNFCSLVTSKLQINSIFWNFIFLKRNLLYFLKTIKFDFYIYFSEVEFVAL